MKLRKRKIMPKGRKKNKKPVYDYDMYNMEYEMEFLNNMNFRNALVKIAAVLLMVCLNWAGLSAVVETFAYFNDTENSLGNIFSAGTLDFSLRSGQNNFVPPGIAGNMRPGDTVARDIYIKKEGTLPFKYRVSVVPEDNCLDFYEVLKLKVWYNYYTGLPEEPNYHEHRLMVLKYDGPLKNFQLNFNGNDLDLQIPNSHTYFKNKFYEEDEHWLYFSITYPEGAKKITSQECHFDFIFDGWQTNLSYGEGFFHSSGISNILIDIIEASEDEKEPQPQGELEGSENGNVENQTENQDGEVSAVEEIEEEVIEEESVKELEETKADTEEEPSEEVEDIEDIEDIEVLAGDLGEIEENEETETVIEQAPADEQEPAEEPADAPTGEDSADSGQSEDSGQSGDSVGSGEGESAE